MHRGKFLYFVQPDGEETLLVSSSTSEHKYLLNDFNRQNPESTLDKANLRGAGRIFNNSIDSWYSAGFDLRTPEELMPRITELLGMEVIS